MKKYSVYMIKTADDYLYTGMTNNLEKRFNQHVTGIKTCLKYRPLPFILVFQEYFETKFEAAKREKEIKGWKRSKKEALIQKYQEMNENVYIEE